jgi:hypothetical protein
MRHSTIFVAIAFVIATAATSSIGIPEARAADCSEYRTELLAARKELERGDRAAALAALRRAKAALHACGQADSNDGDTSPHAHGDQTVVS